MPHPRQAIRTAGKGCRKRKSRAIQTTKHRLLEQMGIPEDMRSDYLHLKTDTLNNYARFAKYYILDNDKISAYYRVYGRNNDNGDPKDIGTVRSQLSRLLSHPIISIVVANHYRNIPVAIEPSQVLSQVNELIESTDKDEVRARMIELKAKISGLTKPDTQVNVAIINDVDREMRDKVAERANNIVDV